MTKRFIVFWLLILACPAWGHELISTQSGQYTIEEVSPKTVAVMNTKNRNIIASFTFKEHVYDLNGHPDLPYVLITVSKQRPSEIYDKEYGAAPPKHLDCKTFILNLKSWQLQPFENTCSGVENIWSPDGKWIFLPVQWGVMRAADLEAYLAGTQIPITRIKGFNHGCGGMADADAMRWVNDTHLTFSGGACGTSFTYIFATETGKTTAYCGPFQKPRYGCPSSFPSAAEYAKAIKKLTAP